MGKVVGFFGCLQFGQTRMDSAGLALIGSSCWVEIQNDPWLMDHGCSSHIPGAITAGANKHQRPPASNPHGAKQVLLTLARLVNEHRPSRSTERARLAPLHSPEYFMLPVLYEPLRALRALKLSCEVLNNLHVQWFSVPRQWIASRGLGRCSRSCVPLMFPYARAKSV